MRTLALALLPLLSTLPIAYGLIGNMAPAPGSVRTPLGRRPAPEVERAEPNFVPRGKNRKSFASACFKTVKLCAAEIGFKMVKVCGRPETQPPSYDSTVGVQRSCSLVRGS